MQITDDLIRGLSSEELFDRDFLYSWLETPEPEERQRLLSLMEIRAKDLGVQKRFASTAKEYIKADESAEKERKREAAKIRSVYILDRDGNGKPLASIDNFLVILENDPKFRDIKFNLLTYSPEQMRNGKMERWLDSDDAETRRYIEKEYGFHSAQKCDDALRIVFAKNQYHPIRDLVDSFEWDGQERIPYLLHTWTKCEDTAYTR